MNIFHKLRWKLTLNYTIVTVCALLVITIILGGILLPRLFLPNNLLSPEGLVRNIQRDVSPLFSYVLSQSPMDTELVRLLVKDASASITGFKILRIGSMQISIWTVAMLRALIVSADGILLGKTELGFPESLMIGKPFDPNQFRGLEAPYKAALSGDENPANLYTVTEPDNRFILAFPISNSHSTNPNHVVGVAIILIDSLPTQRDIPANIFHIAWRSLLLFLLGAGIMGALFGTFFANGLSSRFKRLFTVIDAWSAGDFSKFITDNTGDEITHFSQHLNNMAKQLQELLRQRQEMAVSEERNRLARDLHDSAKQQALAASFQLGTALTLYDTDPQEAKKHLVEADTLVDVVRNELTNLVHELRPLEFDGQDFSEILKDYVQEWSQRSGIGSNINIDGKEETSLETREALFRITQEALANVIRHSSANSVEISLEFTDYAVILRIKDDGCGFDINSPHTGLGLSSMQQRAQALGGSFVVDSTPGQGTQITVNLPVKS
jgi:signal transduction histidine kinase